MHPSGPSPHEREAGSAFKDADAQGTMREPDSVRTERAARVLIEAIRALSKARSTEVIARVVRSVGTALVESDRTAYIVREDDALISIEVEAGGSAREPSEDVRGQHFSIASVFGHALHTREQVAIVDVLGDPRVPHEDLRALSVRSMVLTPVRANAASALIASFWSRPNHPTPEQLALLQDLADATAMAAENVELSAELERRVERRTLELRDANRDLEAFSYSVAHDLRAPLSAMLVTRSVLERSYGAALDSQGVKLLRDIERSGKRMGELIGGLLQFARCARVELAKERVDISSLAASAVMALRQQNLSRDVQVRVEPGMKAHADPTLMEVVIANLLNNAFKYTKDRYPAEIHVGVRQESGRSVFFVRDNGAGFDMASASELFVPFKRLHPAHLFDGHGVGLATVSRIVEKHGGQVWAESSPGQGATFYFSLPSQG